MACQAYSRVIIHIRPVTCDTNSQPAGAMTIHDDDWPITDVTTIIERRDRAYRCNTVMVHFVKEMACR